MIKWILTIGIVLRIVVWQYAYFHVPINSDEAIVGLEAKHIFNLEFPLAPWGQGYNGTLEDIFAAPFYLLTGNSIFTIRFINLFLSITSLLLFYFFIKITFDKKTTLFAAILIAIPPPYLLMAGSFTPHNITNFTFTISLFIVFHLLIIEQTPRKKNWYAFLLGVIGGIGDWEHYQIFIVLLSISITMLIIEPKAIFKKWTWYGLLGFVLGGIPLWICTWQLKGYNFSVTRTINWSHGYEKLCFLIKETLCGLLGLKVPVYIDSDLWLSWPSWIFYIGILLWSILFVASLWAPVVHKHNNTLLIIYSILLFVSTSKMERTEPEDIRYILNFLICLIPLAVLALAYIDKKYSKIAWSIIFCLISIHLGGYYRIYSHWKNPDFLNSNFKLPDYNTYSQLFNFLKKKHIDGVYTRYWLAYPLSYLTNEEILASASYDERFNHYEPYYLKKIMQTTNPAILTHYDYLNKFNPHEMAQHLSINNITYQTKNIGRLMVFYNFSQLRQNTLIPIPKTLYKASASHNAAATHLAFDNKIETFWDTQKNQRPGMYFELDLGKNYEIGSIVISHGRRLGDYAHEILVQVSLDLQNWDTIYQSNSLAMSICLKNKHLYFYENSGEIHFHFEPIHAQYMRFIQNGTSQRFDWSIGELEIFAKP